MTLMKRRKPQYLRSSDEDDANRPSKCLLDAGRLESTEKLTVNDFRPEIRKAETR